MSAQNDQSNSQAEDESTPSRGRSELLRPVVEPAITMESVQRFVQVERTRTRRMVLWLGLFFLLLIAVVMSVLIAGGIYMARTSLGSASDMKELTQINEKTQDRVTGIETQIYKITEGNKGVQVKVQEWESGYDVRDEKLKGDLKNFSKWVDERDQKHQEAVSTLEQKISTLELTLTQREEALNKALITLNAHPAMTTSVSGTVSTPVTSPVKVAPVRPTQPDVSPTASAEDRPDRLTENEVLARSTVDVPSVSPEEIISQSFPNGDHYRGQFKDGVMHGWGTYEEEDGTVYEGPFVEGIRRGKGILRTPAGERYEGDFVADHRHGYGVYVLSNGDRYAGQIANDRIEGFGTMSYANGNLYIGEFRAGLKHGTGTFTFQNGDVYDGTFVQDVREGKGVYTFSDGSTYDGDFKGGNRHGNGTYTYVGGEQYVGLFRDGKKNGKGICIYPDGSQIETKWKDDQLVE